MVREPSVGHMTSIWAHRGTSSEAPENTLPAFELAISQGADGFELDVQRTADGELLVCHDETIDRMSGASGAVVGLTLDEIRSHDFGGSFGLHGVKAPTLREVFDLMRGNDVVCNVELKDSLEPYPGMAAQVLDLIRECGLAERIWISSFNHWTLRELAGADRGGVRLGVLYAEPLVDPWDYATRLGVQAIHPSWQSLALVPETTERCQETGIAVHAWTCNTTDEIRTALDLGVDAVITDHPARAQAALSR